MGQTIHSGTRRKLIAVSLVLGSSGARGQVLDPDQLEALRLHIESFDTIDVIDPELRAIVERIGPPSACQATAGGALIRRDRGKELKAYAISEATQAWGTVTRQRRLTVPIFQAAEHRHAECGRRS
jgi:hypothetical protein